MFKTMQGCWVIDRHARPTFEEIRAEVARFCASAPGGTPRDIGSLLNADLSKKIRQASVRVRNKGKVVASPGGRDDQGLTGTVDMATTLDATASSPHTLQSPSLDLPDDGPQAPDNGDSRRPSVPANGFG